MNRNRQPQNTPFVRLARVSVVAAVAAVFGCGNDNGGGPGFQQNNLVANVSGSAPITDPNLLNAWGIARSPTGPWWVSDNHAGVATVYDSQGHPVPTNDPLVVTIPPPAGSPPGAQSAPTGIVFNGTTDFVVTNGAEGDPPTLGGPAVFISSTEDGTIAGWNPNANANEAILTVDNSAGGAIYKGLAIGGNSNGNFLYASNFHAGTVDVFDGTFAPVTLSGSFTDPNLPRGFAPFGIQNINGDIFVTYAKQDANKEDDVQGTGNGYVDIFDSNGTFLNRFASQGQLDSPWGVALAPASFGRFGGAVIVGNFGDGHLNAFDPISGTFQGQLNRQNGGLVTIAGLWGIGFGNGGTAGSVDTLYFAAGPNDENGGLFGTLAPLNQ